MTISSSKDRRLKRSNRQQVLVPGVLKIGVEKLDIRDAENAKALAEGKCCLHMNVKVVQTENSQATSMAVEKIARCTSGVFSNAAMTQGSSSLSWFGNMSIPFCLPTIDVETPTSSPRSAFGTLDVVIYRRDIISGQDVQVAQTSIEIRDLNPSSGSTSHQACPLRNKRGRGDRGVANFSMEFIPTSTKHRSRASLRCVRLFIAEIRCNDDQSVYLTASMGGKELTTNEYLRSSSNPTRRPGAPVFLWNECLEFEALKPEDQDIKLTLFQMDGSVLGGTVSKIKDIPANGKGWVQLGEQCSVRIVPVEIPNALNTDTVLPQGTNTLAVHFKSISGVNEGSKVYIVTQMFPLIDGESRGRLKFRDTVRTSTHEGSSKSDTGWDETVQIPWTGAPLRGPIDCQTKPRLHFSVWDENNADGGAIAEKSLDIDELIEKTNVAGSRTNSKFIQLEMNECAGGGSRKITLSLNGKFLSPTGVPTVSPTDTGALPSSLEIFRIRNVPKEFKSEKITVQVLGQYGVDQTLKLETEPCSVQNNELLIVEKLDFGSILGDNGRDTLKIIAKTKNGTAIASISLPMERIPEGTQSKGLKAWHQMSLADSSNSFGNDPPGILLQCNYGDMPFAANGEGDCEIPRVLESKPEVSGIKTNLLGDTRIKPTNSGGRQAPPGVVNVQVLEMVTMVDDMTQKINEAWVVANCSEGWSWSTPHSQQSVVNEKSVRYTWSSSKKFPLHWSIKERSAPCLKFEVKMQTSDGQMIRKTFQAVDLAGFVLCPGEELETWLLESDPAGFPGKLHVRLQFDTRKQKNLRDKKSLKAPSKGILNGRLHVHLRGGTKLVRPTNSSSPLCALLDVYSAGTSAQAAAMRSRIDEDGGSNPTWNEHFVSPVQVGNGMVPILNIIVQTAEREPIGLTSVPLFDSIFLDGHVLDARLPVRPWDEAAASQNKIGELGVSVQVLLDGSPTSTEDVSAAAPFVVTVLDGESFDYSGYDWNGQIEPAVQVVLNGSDERQTNAVSHDSRASPAWNRKLYFPSLPKNDRFTVSLLNDNTLSEECKVIACAHVQLRPLGTQSTQKQIAELKCPDSDSIVGKLHLSVEDTNLTLGGGCWQGTLSEQDRKQMELLQASAYIKVGVCRGRKFRDSIGRVHKAIVRLVCISKNSEPEKIIGETDLENDGLRKSQRIKEDRCFVWNHDFSFKRGDFNFASSKFLLRVIDCTMTGPMKDIGEVDISGMIKGMDGKGDVANDPAWVDLNPVTDNSEGIQPDKGCGSLQFHVDQIEPRRGLLSLKVKDVVGNLTSRSFALLGDNVSEFVKARVEPDGITARTKSNSLSDMLELEFSNCDENRDTLSVSLLCDDPDLIENVLGKCSLNIQRVIGAPNTWHTFMEPLSHAVTGKPLDCKVSCEVKLSTKRTTLDTSANPSTVSLPPVDANTEAIKCLTAKRLKSIFYKIDRDGSGTVSQDEFITAMHEDLDIVDILGSQVQNARKLFDDLDSNKDGELSWDEFQKVCVQQAELAGSSANASQGEGDHFFQAQVGGDEAFAPVGDGPQMETSRQPETQRSSSSSSGKSSRANTRKKPLRPGKRRKSFTRPIRTRDTQTFEKHDENMMARRDLDDPHELKAQIRALREEKRNVEEECRMLKLESRRSRGKNQRKISETNRLMSHALSGTTGPQPETSMTDDVRIELEKRLLLLEAENIALKERPDVFSATGGGDESFAPVQDDTPEHDTSTKVKLRQLELEKQQQQELHDKELEALRAENQRAQNELADIQERQEALEREAAEKASRLELEKQNTKKLHATLNELNFERMQYAPIDGDDKAGRNRYRLVQMMALEAEQTRLLEDARSKRKEQNAAAARLQSAIRGCKDRAKFKEAKATRSFAAVVLQASYRARKAKQNYDSEREQVSGASRSIQAAYRGRLARKDLAYKQKAAARIQGGFRGRKDREKVDKLKRERASALAIQRQLRRRKSTKAVHQLRTQKQKETDAAILLQSHVRANQGRHSFNLKKDKWEQEQKEERSATSIQKIVRRKQARRDVKKAEQLKRGNHSAAYKIQKNVRKRMQGRSPVMLRTHSRPRVSKDENSYTDLNNATARLIQHLSQSRHRDASIEKAKDTLAGALHDISNSNTN